MTRVPISLLIRLLNAGAQFVLELTPSVAGVTETLSFPIGGNVSLPIPLSFLGQLIVDVSGWRISPNALAFDLAARVQPAIPIVQAIAIGGQHVSVPLQAPQRALLEPKSASDLLALAELLRSSAGVQIPGYPPMRDIRTDNTPTVVKEGVDPITWGPNWREDRVIMAVLDHGRVREKPVLYGQQGAGNVYFKGWLNDDPTDASFIVHIGNNLFGGWGSIRWQVIGYYADIDITPRRISPVEAAVPPHDGVSSVSNGGRVPRSDSNGYSRKRSRIVNEVRMIMEDLEQLLQQDSPEAGGSIRA